MQVSLGVLMINFVRYNVYCFTSALILLIGYQILTGKINTRGLLLTKDGEAIVSPARVQLLVLTMTGAFLYLMQFAGDPTQLPNLPQQLIFALGGSNLLYAGGKGYSLWVQRKKNNSDRKENEEGGT